VETVQNWQAPQSQKEVRRFLGFTNYYRMFVPGYSRIAGPLTKLTSKNTPFSWGKKEEAAFQGLKKSFAQSPVLHQ